MTLENKEPTVGILASFRQFFAPSKFYQCPNCGYNLPKEEAVISGYASQSSLQHVHCPQCGKILTNAP